MIYGNTAFTDIPLASFIARTEAQRAAVEAFDGPSPYEVEQKRYWVGEPVRLIDEDLMVEDLWLAGPFKTKAEAEARRLTELAEHPNARAWVSHFTPAAEPGLLDAYCQSVLA